MSSGDPIAETFVNVVENCGWFVPYKTDVVCVDDHLEFMAVMLPDGNAPNGCGSPTKTVYVTVGKGYICAGKKRAEHMGPGAFRGDAFACALSDPDCFEQFGKELEKLYK